MSVSGSSVEFLLLTYAFAIIGIFHTATIFIKFLCRAVAEMVKDLDDCWLECRKSHARLQTTQPTSEPLTTHRKRPGRS
jgi:hypothetical protein